MGACDQIVLDRQILEDAATFEHLHDAALDDLVRRQAVEPFAVELDIALGDLAALGVQQPRDRLQGRRLAGAVGAEKGGDMPLLGGQRYALQHQNRAVVDDFDVVEREHEGPSIPLS